MFGMHIQAQKSSKGSQLSQKFGLAVNAAGLLYCSSTSSYLVAMAGTAGSSNDGAEAWTDRHG